MSAEPDWTYARTTVEPYRRQESEPHVFIQWKGTDVCFDFWCDCGSGGHYDGYFAYAFRCPGCGREFTMPSTVYPAAGNVRGGDSVELDSDG